MFQIHWRRWVFTLLFCISVFVLLGFIKFTQVKAAIAFGESFPEASETVQSTVVERSQWQAKLQLSGEVLATRSLHIRNELEGMITEVGFASGGSVKAGDVLLRLDISNEEAQLDAINADIRIAQLDVNRFAKLLEQNASSADQYERAKAQLAVAEARARALKSTIAKKTIVAPFDGRVSLHQFELGGLLAANSEVTHIIGKLDPVWIDFYVPQDYATLAIGSPITVHSNALASGSSQAKVVSKEQSISTRSRNLLVRAELASPGEQLSPGALVKIELPIGNAQSIVRLPNVAIRYDAFGSYVYILNKDDKGDWRASRQGVTVTSTNNDSAIVTDGLEQGAHVATLGSYKLREGMLVYLDPAQG